MKFKFKKLGVNKINNYWASFILEIGGGFSFEITYYPQKYHLKLPRGIELKALKAKKIAFILRAWSKYNGDVYNISGWKDGDMLDFNEFDDRMYVISSLATQYYKEWDRERKERKNNDKNN